MRLRLLFLLAAAVGLNAQPPADFEASVKAAMAPSIAQQRVSVRKQTAGLAHAAPPQFFFTTPFPPVSTATADCDPLPNEQLRPIIEHAAQKSGVDAQLVHAVINQESGGRPCALSAKGAQGLMQLMPATADDYDVDDPFDPQQNIEAGTKLLRSLLDRYNNDPSLALGAYNAGATRVDQAGGVPAIPETKDYVTTILEKLGVLPKSARDSGSKIDASISR
ncbi:MAG TPA: lytic transglycosylase domain-containing protein [Bryobacteraceae bacterium]|nr:lytic transglycosylase domain-containing protein [Bryobacteraceae bacterium]